MQLFVGLGNPGTRHAGNRHNIGFLVLDAVAGRHDFSQWRRRFQGVAAEGELGGERVLLLKPATYMNESGRAVAEAAHFYKLQPRDILVFHDEVDLPPGKLRVKVGGGVAGHNGLRSLSAHVGNDYRRVRIGVGHPGVKELVHAHVLSDFAKTERAWVSGLCEVIADNAALLAKGKDSTFQNKIHLAMEAKGLIEPKKPTVEE
jgi:PTH1 family peptidyl-tRNA hydrolase